MGKVLVITSVASMIEQFLLPSIGLLQELGCQVHVACNFEKGSTSTVARIEALKKELTDRQVTYFQVDFERNVSKVAGNALAYRQVADLLSKNHYDIVHCHSPIGGLITRLAGRKTRRQGTKILYTAHGFHFYKGAPLKNWFLYYPVEKLCAKMTDILITINREDYALAKEKMQAGQVLYVPGVGVDLRNFHPDAGAISRKDLNIPPENQILFNVGELCHRKNHELLIRAVARLDHVTVLIAGRGPLDGYLRDLASQLGCDVRFLGHRNDIAALCGICDVFVFPSFQEGLPVALMEAMACGKAVACSKIRGNTDLMDPAGGAFFDPHSEDSCYSALKEVLSGNLAAMGQHNRQAVRAFSLETVNQQLLQIYKSLL